MNLPDIGDLIEKTTSRAKATRSVMSPLQWALPVILSVAISGFLWGPDRYRDTFMGVILVTVAYFLIVYTYFGFKDPDRLHTEEHREHMVRMSTYRDSRGVVIEGTATNVPPPSQLTPPPAQLPPGTPDTPPEQSSQNPNAGGHQ